MTSAVRLIRNDQLAQNVPYAYVATAEAPARSVWVAGACPLDAQGATVAVGDYAGQAHQVMRNLVTALEGAGAALADVVKTTVYVASARRQDLVTAWNVYREHMSGHDAPSTLLGVTVLGYPDQLVEVEAVAVLRQLASEPGGPGGPGGSGEPGGPGGSGEPGGPGGSGEPGTG
jgi:enamine deaminase RidA (YjgF/YER057c/UK114 family)